jgi:hypothetical protein
MARAFIENVECRVDVDKDLGESWAVSVVPPPNRRQGASRILVVKLHGQDQEKITRGALEILQKAGAIDRFEL